MPEPICLAHEERGAGPVLLLVHGFPLNATMWIEQLKGLAEMRRVCAVDLRGHGCSAIEAPEGTSVDLFADDLARSMDDMGASVADLCGLSMGGYVVFAFWRRHRERVRSLIFCDTKPEADTEEGRSGRERMAVLVGERGMQGLWEQIGSAMLASSPSEDAKEATRRMFLATPPEVAVADLLAMRDRPDSTPYLASIDVPVLWIAGEEDALTPAVHGQETAAKIPGSRFVAVPKAGHMAPLENPQAVNTAIAEFLKSVDGRRAQDR